MKKLLILIVMLFFLAIAAGFLTAQSTNKPSSASGGDVEHGKQAFLKHGCFRCHGYSGNGGTGPRLAQNPIGFQNFRSYVRRPKRSMPPYGTQVTDTELSDIYAYIKSTPPSPDPKSIPLLNDKN